VSQNYMRALISRPRPPPAGTFGRLTWPVIGTMGAERRNGMRLYFFNAAVQGRKSLAFMLDS